MEQLTGVLVKLNEMLKQDAPLFISDEPTCTMVSIIRNASAMVSSRYHGIVTSMPLASSQLITMDERIRNLMIMARRLSLEVDDVDLEEALPTMLVLDDAGAPRALSGGKNLERMGQMGQRSLSTSRPSPRFPFRPELALTATVGPPPTPAR